MCGPPTFGWHFWWIAASAGGMAKPDSGFGTWVGWPETVEMVMVSPESTVTSGLSAASKYPQCTVSGHCIQTMAWPCR